MNTSDVHQIRMDNRSDLIITGVERVSSFDVHIFELVTTAGILRVEGDALHMKHFDMNERTVRIEGKISGMSYDDEQRRKNLVGRLLK